MILSSATTRNRPTPIATATISTILGTPGTCSASTCRSGSDSVINMPTTKPISAMNQSLRERVMALPTCWPMGVIARSVPSVNRPMPSISSAAPITNPMSASLETGTTAKHNKNTSPVIGRTDVSASRHFSRSILRLRLGISSILSLGRPRLSDHGYSFNSIILRGVLSIECAVKCSGKNIRPHRHTQRAA